MFTFRLCGAEFIYGVNGLDVGERGENVFEWNPHDQDLADVAVEGEDFEGVETVLEVNDLAERVLMFYEPACVDDGGSGAYGCEYRHGGSPLVDVVVVFGAVLLR